MGFAMAPALWALVLVPAAAALYVAHLRRFPRDAVLHPRSVALAVAAARAGPWRRHLPAALLLFALTAALLALARPTLPLPVPADRSVVMLAMDTSGSMRSEDIAPNRLEAAKAAARAFVAALPRGLRVGLVAFGGYAELVVPPTTDRERLRAAIDGLGFIRRTAIGEGLLEAVMAILGASRPAPDPWSGTPTPLVVPPDARPVRPGSAVIVLLSDGRSNAGVDALEVAAFARRQGIVVHTVGVGQPYAAGTVWTIGGTLDEETLREMAAATGGAYFHAASARGLHQIYRRLARDVGWERRPVEVPALAALVAAVALVGALGTAIVLRPVG